MREVLAQMLLPLKEALLGHPIHNNLFHLIGTFHLQAIENLTNRTLSRWGLFFLVEHVELHCGPIEEQVLCVFLLCFSQQVVLEHQILFMAWSHYAHHIRGRKEVFFNPESKSIPREFLLLGRSRSYLWQKKKKRVMVFLYKDRFRLLA